MEKRIPLLVNKNERALKELQPELKKYVRQHIASMPAVKHREVEIELEKLFSEMQINKSKLKNHFETEYGFVLRFSPNAYTEADDVELTEFVRLGSEK